MKLRWFPSLMPKQGDFQVAYGAPSGGVKLDQMFVEFTVFNAEALGFLYRLHMRVTLLDAALS